MTPHGFDRLTKRFGISTAAIAARCEFTGQAIGRMRYSRQPPREVREVLICIREKRRAELFRKARRARAAAQHTPHDAVKRAANLLDEGDEKWLADCLLRARPEFLCLVATGVVVHALMRCLPEVWDVLMESDIANHPLASDWFLDSDDAFVWSPPRWSLYP